MGKIICVYKITSPSGKIYIGSTIDFKKRLKHYRLLDCKAQTKLYNSFIKHGYHNHVIEVVCNCSREYLYKLERFYGDLFDCVQSGLNLTLPGYGQTPSLISESTINKMKTSQRKERNNFYGRKHSPESIDKMREAHKNKSPETILKMSEAQKGKVASEKSRAKMAQSQTGRKHNSDTKLKMRYSSSNLKYVLCRQTGIFYAGATEAANIYNMNKHTLRNKLNGNKRNNTSLIYV